MLWPLWLWCLEFLLHWVFQLDFKIFKTIASFIKISSGHSLIIKLIFIKFFRTIWENRWANVLNHCRYIYNADQRHSYHNQIKFDFYLCLYKKKISETWSYIFYYTLFSWKYSCRDTCSNLIWWVQKPFLKILASLTIVRI